MIYNEERLEQLKMFKQKRETSMVYMQKNINESKEDRQRNNTLGTLIERKNGKKDTESPKRSKEEKLSNLIDYFSSMDDSIIEATRASLKSGQPKDNKINTKNKETYIFIKRPSVRSNKTITIKKTKNQNTLINLVSVSIEVTIARVLAPLVALVVLKALAPLVVLVVLKE